jgi:hypothetical protein
MIATTPPATIIRLNKRHGSFGYGAKVDNTKEDGEHLCIPFNQAIVLHIREQERIPRFTVVQVSREWFNGLEDHTKE